MISGHDPRNCAAGKPPAKPKNHRWPSFFKSLPIPLVVLVLFYFAPHWLNSKVRNQIIGDLNNNTRLTAAERNDRIEFFSKVDFAKVALDGAPELATLHEGLVKAGLAQTYRFLRWGFGASLLLVVMQLAAMGYMTILNSKAKESQENLIRNYKLGWRIGMTCAFIQILLLVPLLTYASYEFPIIWADHWYPKLVLVIVILGGTVLITSAKILLTKVPLRFNEPMSRRVSRAEAPELWDAVLTAAARLNATPPDNIIIGLQLNFYVTELAVWDGKELAQGRTLFLSYPLLKQLPEEEIIAIIGHELGHFIGDDTRLTREFYPLHLKTHGTLVALAGAKYIGWTTLHFLNFFDWSFAETKNTVSRRRELLADSKAAAVTSPRVAASALVRFHVLLEAFKQGMVDAVTKGGQSPLDIPLHTVVREKLPAGVAFWDELFQQKLPHPLDTHPALHVRLEALGQTIDAKAAEALAVQENESAYSRWLAHRSELFADLRNQADAAIGTMRSRAQVTTADYQTADGRELLDKHFPVRKWKSSARAFWICLIVFGCLAGGLVALAMFLPAEMGPLRIFFAFFALLPVYGVGVLWVRHRNGELTLDANGLSYTGWHRQLRFADLQKISYRKTYGSVSATFHLKQAQRPFWKMTLFEFKRKNLSYSFSGLAGVKQLTVAQTIFNYFTRQIPK
ncbi:MAG TPA: M48 family metallopeptidase [Verrucomicrobiae bacterium]|jgi:Zn-dependent protease with chaperone function|nr:M48 family metallopeptidase [Verrucomicrobiae bacterium]